MRCCWRVLLVVLAAVALHSPLQAQPDPRSYLALSHGGVWCADEFTALGGIRRVAVTRTGDLTGPVKVALMVNGGFAELNADYELPSGTGSVTVKWASGEGGPKYVEYVTIDDDEVEGYESINFVIAHPSGNAVLVRGKTETSVWIYPSDEGPNDSRLMKGRNHPIAYYVSFPRGYNSSQEYPVVFAIDGAAAWYRGMIDEFRAARGDLPFILVTPVTFSNLSLTGISDVMREFYTPAEISLALTGRYAFDEAAVLAIQDDMRQWHHGREKFFISGYSGGGLLTWRVFGRHPERLYAAAQGCPTFSTNIFLNAPVSTHPDRETLPMRVFQGEDDPDLYPFLENMWLNARNYLSERGFGNLDRIVFPGVGHVPFAHEVLESFKSVL